LAMNEDFLWETERLQATHTTESIED